MIKKLLKRLHRAVFDTSPDGLSAIRIATPRGLVVSVSSGKLQIQLAKGWGYSWGLSFGLSQLSEPVVEVDLSLYTIRTLVDFLNNGLPPIGGGWGSSWGLSWGDRFVTAEIADEELADLSAMVLVDMPAGGIANEINLAAFTSLVWVILSAYAKELVIAAEAVIQALRQMVMWTADSEWLSFWGQLFGIDRKPDEGDQSYLERMQPEIFRRRLNPLAIEKAILDATGKHVKIVEPWNDIFQLDESKLSGSHRMYDGTSVGYHLIKPESVGPVNWSDVLPVIERNRAAGVLVLPPESIHALSTSAVTPTVRLSVEHLNSGSTRLPGERAWPGIV